MVGCCSSSCTNILWLYSFLDLSTFCQKQNWPSWIHVSYKCWLTRDFNSFLLRLRQVELFLYPTLLHEGQDIDSFPPFWSHVWCSRLHLPQLMFSSPPAPYHTILFRPSAVSLLLRESLVLSKQLLKQVISGESLACSTESLTTPLLVSLSLMWLLSNLCLVLN